MNVIIVEVPFVRSHLQSVHITLFFGWISVTSTPRRMVRTCCMNKYMMLVISMIKVASAWISLWQFPLNSRFTDHPSSSFRAIKSCDLSVCCLKEAPFGQTNLSVKLEFYEKRGDVVQYLIQDACYLLILRNDVSNYFTDASLRSLWVFHDFCSIPTLCYLGQFSITSRYRSVTWVFLQTTYNWISVAYCTTSPGRIVRNLKYKLEI